MKFSVTSYWVIWNSHNRVQTKLLFKRLTHMRKIYMLKCFNESKLLYPVKQVLGSLHCTPLGGSTFTHQTIYPVPCCIQQKPLFSTYFWYIKFTLYTTYPNTDNTDSVSVETSWTLGSVIIYFRCKIRRSSMIDTISIWTNRIDKISHW